jgi:hypothetical protein
MYSCNKCITSFHAKLVEPFVRTTDGGGGSENNGGGGNRRSKSFSSADKFRLHCMTSLTVTSFARKYNRQTVSGLQILIKIRPL